MAVCHLKRAVTIFNKAPGPYFGIAVDEDGEHRNIRRMSHGRHVVNRRLKTESDFGTEASCYVNNIFIRYV